MQLPKQPVEFCEGTVISKADGFYSVDTAMGVYDGVPSARGSAEINDKVTVGFRDPMNRRLPVIFGNASQVVSQSTNRVSLATWDQSLISPSLSLFVNGRWSPAESASTLISPFSADSFEFQGMARPLGMVSLGPVFVYVYYVSNASLTGYDKIRIKAMHHETNATAWTYTINITNITNATNTSIPTTSNLFWDPAINVLIILDFNAYAVHVPDPLQIPTLVRSRAGPFRRFAGYANGTVFHHNAANLNMFRYDTDSGWSPTFVAQAVIANYDPANHTPYKSGQLDLAALDTNRALNRPWAYYNGSWFHVFSSVHNSFGGSPAGTMTMIKVNAETNEVSSSLIKSSTKDDLKFFESATWINHCYEEVSGFFPSFGHTVDGQRGRYSAETILLDSGGNVVSGGATDFSLSLLEGVQYPRTAATYISVPDPPFTPDTVPVGTYFYQESISDQNDHFVPQPAFNGLYTPGQFASGKSLIGFPYSKNSEWTLRTLRNTALFGTSFLANPGPPFASSAYLFNYFASMNMVVTNQPEPGSDMTGTLEVKLKGVPNYFPSSFIGYINESGQLVNSVEVSERVTAKITGPYNGSWVSVSPLPAEDTDLIPYNEVIWQVASGQNGTVKGYDFALYNYRSNTHEQARLKFCVISPDFQVVYRSPIMGNLEKKPSPPPATDPEYFEYVYFYPTNGTGWPQIRLFTDPTSGQSLLLIGLWTAKTTDGSDPAFFDNDHWTTDIYIYDVTNPASPTLFKHYYEAAKTQSENTLPKGLDFGRMILSNGTLKYVTFTGGQWKLQAL